MNVTFRHPCCLRFDELKCLFDQSGVAVSGAPNSVNTREREDVTVLLFFFRSPTPHPGLPTGFLHSTQFSLAFRNQDGGPSNATIDIYDFMGK